MNLQPNLFSDHQQSMITVAIAFLIFVLFSISLVCIIYLMRVICSSYSFKRNERRTNETSGNPENEAVNDEVVALNRPIERNAVSQNAMTLVPTHQSLITNDENYQSVPDALPDHADPGNFVLNALTLTKTASMTTHVFSRM